jgi:hypothetical protein
MLSAQELEDVKQYVLRELPRVLEQDPQFVVFIEGILSEKFPRRDEFARLLDEFTSFRQETRERFDRVDADISEIKADVAVLKTDVAVLKTDVAVLKTDVAVLKTDVAVLRTDVGDLKGENLERRYRERPYTYFGRILRRIKRVNEDELFHLLDDAADRQLIADDEVEDIRLLDVIALGRNAQGQLTYLAIEVSSVVDEHDVDRAIRRANVLARATGIPSLPVVAGNSITSEALQAVQTAGMWRVIHGAAIAP